jgi:arylsulfatase
MRQTASRRERLRQTLVALAALALPCLAPGQPQPPPKPNIIFVLADDLGYAELGCYGQTRIRTPNLDRLAGEGIRFLQHYSGSTVCAPSRCCLLTGKHTGHAFIRDNGELPTEGQRAIPANTLTLGRVLQQAGYRTAVIGKWGLGGPGSSGEPNRQGFDHWFGYLCQRHAHNHYPTYLWRNGEKVSLSDNTDFAAHQRLEKQPQDNAAYARYAGKQYAPDLMCEEALAFIRENRRRPFFLYFATTIPHLALQVPDDSLREYLHRWPETPYLGQRGYLPHPTPRAAYAAMISRMDRDVGRLLALLDELGLAENTLVLFSSDNGATFDVGGYDPPFFKGTGPLRGHKGNLYEGGIRVPLLARWPGHIAAGRTSDHVCASWDVLPTLAAIAGAEVPQDIDGISFLPALLDQEKQPRHDYLYWEYRSGRGSQAVRMGKWKGIRRNLARHRDAPLELYDLTSDPGEQKDVATAHAQIVNRIEAIMRAAQTPSELFPLPTPPVTSARSNAPVIPKDEWRIVRVSSESRFNGKVGSNAIDGNPETHWHTQWKDARPPHPHEIVIDLGRTRQMIGFRYQPRTDGGVNGTIHAYELLISDRPDAFGPPAVKGNFARATHEQEVRFQATRGRYVCLRSLSEIHDRPFTCVAELTLLGH